MIARYALRRVIVAIPVLIGVTLISYGLMFVTAGNIVPGLEVNPNINPADVARIRANLGLDQPFLVQYLNWIGVLWPLAKVGLWHGRATTGLLEGDLGRSLLDGSPVMSHILDRLPNTLELTFTAMLLGVLLAIPLAVLAARRRGSTIDHGMTVISVAGVAVPSFWLALLLILLFSVQLSQWGLPALPSGGATSSMRGGDLLDRLAHLVLPAIVLAFGYLAIWSRYTRSSMLDILSQDFVRTARAKGMGERRVTYVHALRNAVIPLVTLIGLELPNLFAGGAITEIVFIWPGIGRLALESATSHDYTMVMALTTFTAVMVVVGNLIADVLYAVLDPRIRLS
jgi:peptide/nickel transport system permease protein